MPVLLKNTCIYTQTHIWVTTFGFSYLKFLPIKMWSGFCCFVCSALLKLQNILPRGHHRSNSNYEVKSCLSVVLSWFHRAQLSVDSPRLLQWVSQKERGRMNKGTNEWFKKKKESEKSCNLAVMSSLLTASLDSSVCHSLYIRIIQSLTSWILITLVINCYAK